MTGIEVYQRADGRWSWRLRAANGRVIANDGGQGYENEADCTAMADAVVGGSHRPRAQEAPVNARSHRIDVIIAEHTTTRHTLTDPVPTEGVDVAPDSSRRIILLASTKESGAAEAERLGITPVAVVTPRAIDAAHGIEADLIVASSDLTAEEAAELRPHAEPSLATSQDPN